MYTCVSRRLTRFSVKWPCREQALVRVLGDRLGVTPTMWILAVCALLGSLPVLASRLLRMRELPRELDLLDTSATADRE